MNRNAGFTLIELLVALAVFAVMSAMAYSGLASVLEARENVNQSLENTADIQGAMHRIQTDLEQTVARSIRDGYGDPQPAMTGVPDQGLQLTRNGWRNPLSEPRSHLQRVAYRIDEEDRLVRLHWRVLDRAQDSAPVESVLLENVDDLEWRFLNAQRDWVDAWPPASATAGPAGSAGVGADTSLPLAVELRLETPAWGELRYLFKIPGGGS